MLHTVVVFTGSGAHTLVTTNLITTIGFMTIIVKVKPLVEQQHMSSSQEVLAAKSLISHNMQKGKKSTAGQDSADPPPRSATVQDPQPLEEEALTPSRKFEDKGMVSATSLRCASGLGEGGKRAGLPYLQTFPSAWSLWMQIKYFRRGLRNQVISILTTRITKYSRESLDVLSIFP